MAQALAGRRVNSRARERPEKMRSRPQEALARAAVGEGQCLITDALNRACHDRVAHVPGPAGPGY